MAKAWESKMKISMDKVISRYERGESSTTIAVDAGVNARWIRQQLRNHGVKMRKAGDYAREYHLNEQFFDEWTDRMAYVLGFMTSKSYVNGQRSSITIYNANRGILERIRKAMKSTHPIKWRDHRVYEFKIHSYRIHEILLRDYGFQNRKTADQQIPIVQDKKHVPHFMRGMFDGYGKFNQGSRGAVLRFDKLPRMFARNLKWYMNILEVEAEVGVGIHYNNVVVRDPDQIYKFFEIIYHETPGDLYREDKWEQWQEFKHYQDVI